MLPRRGSIEGIIDADFVSFSTDKMTIPQYTHRDRVKFACYNYALEQGLNEEEMVEYFTKAAEKVRAAEKTANLMSMVGLDAQQQKNLGMGLGLAGGLFLGPLAMSAAGHLGYAGGQGVRRLAEGRVASPEEVHLTDESAEYEGAVEEIRRRMILNRLKELQSQAPSNRRLF